MSSIPGSVELGRAEMAVVLLGTGTPNAEPERSGPAAAVLVEGVAYLVDCGPGVVRRAAAAARQFGAAELEVGKLGHVFITHLHSDHTVGYADLILTPWVLERDVPLRAYGPAGLGAMTDHLLAAYRADIGERTAGLEPANREGHRVLVTEIEAGLVFEDERVRVDACRAEHGSWPAYSFRFSAGNSSVVISGDTAPHERMTAFYANCDILVHEVYSAQGLTGLPAEWQRYHASVHTSTQELARIAAKARPGLLVLTHQLLWGESPASLVAEIEAHYAGRVVSGRDLDRFALEI